jgi:hypothetical protein
VFASWHERFCAINGLEQEPPTAKWLTPTRTERVRARFARFGVGQRHAATPPPQEIVGTAERPLADVTVASTIASDALGVSGRD